MQSKNIRPTAIIFWMLLIALFSAISTTIFSETLLNDRFGFALMAIAIVGLCLNITHMVLHTLLAICNPSH